MRTNINKLLRKIHVLIKNRFIIPIALLIIIVINKISDNSHRLAETNQVLLVKTDGIGDFIIWLGTLPAYKEIFVDKKLVLVTMNINASLAKATGYFDEVIVFPFSHSESSVHKYLSFINELRTRCFEAIVQPTYSSTMIGNLFILCLRAQRKISINGDVCNRSKLARMITNRMFDERVYVPEKVVMELIRNAQFVRGLGFGDYKAALPVLPDTSHHLPEKISQYAAIFPGASMSYKCWPTERYANIIKNLYDTYHIPCVLLGAEDENSIAENIIKRLGGIPVYNMIGKTTLLELIYMIRKAIIFIGNDTSGIHIAAATRTPSICIACGMGHKRFTNYEVEVSDNAQTLPHSIFIPPSTCICSTEKYISRCPYRFQSGILPCIDAVTIDVVNQRIQQLLMK